MSSLLRRMFAKLFSEGIGRYILKTKEKKNDKETATGKEEGAFGHHG